MQFLCLVVLPIPHEVEHGIQEAQDIQEPGQVKAK